MTDQEFAELIRRVRDGDQAAAEQCVRYYEPEIRRAARVRLADPRLRRIVDSVDICQSVFGRFFSHAADGQFELHTPAQLLALLLTMTRNKVTDVHRRQTAARRDVGRQVTGLIEHAGVVDDRVTSPSSAAAGQEMLIRVYERLSSEELQLVRARERGDSWAEIAEASGEHPEALRKRLERALVRVRGELGVE